MELFHANWTNFKTLSSSTISDLNEIWHDHAEANGQRKFAKKVDISQKLFEL